jgi:hypothetical protein
MVAGAALAHYLIAGRQGPAQPRIHQGQSFQALVITAIIFVVTSAIRVATGILYARWDPESQSGEGLIYLINGTGYASLLFFFMPER